MHKLLCYYTNVRNSNRTVMKENEMLSKYSEFKTKKLSFISFNHTILPQKEKMQDGDETFVLPLSFSLRMKSNDTMCWCSEAYMDKMLFLCWAQTHPFVDERWDFRLPITLGCREVKHSGQNPPAQPALCGRLLGTSAQLAELPKQVEEVNCCRTALFTPDELPGTSCESEFKPNILPYWTF